ncbi:MAG: porin family protein [Treponema sp.]|jgi:hypothetical protein|nr:porin family protein [Treponema sp.]
MKKVYVLAFLLIAVGGIQSAFSQFLVGGGFQYSSNDSGSTKTTTFVIRPIFLYELNDKFDIGGAVSFAMLTNDLPRSSGEYRAWGIEGIARYKLVVLGPFTPFIGASAGFGMYMPKTSGVDDGTTFGLEGAIGGELKLADHVRFFMQLPLVNFEYESQGDRTDFNFGADTVTDHDIDAPRYLAWIQVGILISF